MSLDDATHPHEAELLALDARKAELRLGWHNRLPFEETLAWTVGWARQVEDGSDPRAVTLAQIDAFRALTAGPAQ